MAWTFDLGEDARISASTARDLLDKLLVKVRFELGALPYEWAFDKKPVWDDTTIYIELFGVPVAESQVRVHYDWTRSRDPIVDVTKLLTDLLEYFEGCSEVEYEDANPKEWDVAVRGSKTALNVLVRKLPQPETPSDEDAVAYLSKGLQTTVGNDNNSLTFYGGKVFGAKCLVVERDGEDDLLLINPTDTDLGNIARTLVPDCTEEMNDNINALADALRSVL